MSLHKNMEKLVSVAQMQSIEKEAEAAGVPNEVLMQNAGKSLADAIIERFEYLKPGNILGLVGGGNNGGDTLVALTYLAGLGWPAQAYLTRSRAFEDPLVSNRESFP